MEFTEAESNMNDLVSEYQQYQVWHLGGASLINNFLPNLTIFLAKLLKVYQ